MLTLLILAGLVVAGVLVARSKRWRSRIRKIEGKYWYFRLWPNVGFKVGGLHWCRHYGKGKH
jgi:hypothetical protein